MALALVVAITPCMSYCQNGWAAEEDSFLCEKCPVGTESITGKCTPCVGGEYASEPGSYHCVYCAAGQESSEDRTGCVPCEAGTWRIYQDTCQPCPDNMYSFAGTDCLTCSSGHRVNADKDGCEPCPKGFRVSASGGCERCASGTVSLTERSTWCVECESGMTASDDGTACITTEVDCGDAPFLDNGSGEKKGNTVKFSCVTR